MNFQNDGLCGNLYGVYINGQLVTDIQKIRLIEQTGYDAPSFYNIFGPTFDRFNTSSNGNYFIMEFDPSLGATTYNTELLMYLGDNGGYTNHITITGTDGTEYAEFAPSQYNSGTTHMPYLHNIFGGSEATWPTISVVEYVDIDNLQMRVTDGEWDGNDGSGVSGGATHVSKVVDGLALPDVPSTDPPDPAIYTQVVNSIDDTTNLTSYSLDGIASTDKKYFSRVRYKDNTDVESDFSDWHVFDTILAPPSNWKAVEVKQSQYQKVAYGNGTFMVCSFDGDVLRSTDKAQTWESIDTGMKRGDYYDIAYHPPTNRWVIVAEWEIYYSEDNGDTWEASPSNGSLGGNEWRNLAYGSGRMVAAGTHGGNMAALWSDDGVNWNGTTVQDYGQSGGKAWGGNAQKFHDVTYGGGKFVGVGFNSTGYKTDTGGTAVGFYSPDGSLWKPMGDGLTSIPKWYHIAYGNNVYVAISTVWVATSSDGITWNAPFKPFGDDNDWQDVNYANGFFVAVAQTGERNRVMYSKDGVNWTRDELPYSHTWKGVDGGDGKWVACSKDGTKRIAVA